MKGLLPLLIAALVAPVAASAHETPHKVVYLLYREGDNSWKIPVNSIEECETMGPEIIESRKISKRHKGYECIPGLM